MSIAATTTTRSLTVERIGDVGLTFTERGAGRPFVILHGGAGPLSVSGFADLLAETEQVRVIAPSHPGFGGTPRPDALDSIRGLAAVYVALLDELELTDVTVIWKFDRWLDRRRDGAAWVAEGHSRRPCRRGRDRDRRPSGRRLLL